VLRSDETREAYAYLLGVLLGDGHLTKSGQFQLDTKDLDFAMATKKALDQITNSNVTIHPAYRVIEAKFPNGFYTYDLRYFRLQKRLRALGLVDTIKRFIPVTEAEKCQFVRGIFDSEGTVGHDGVSIRNTNMRTMAITIKILRELGYNPHQSTYDRSLLHLYPNDSRRFAKQIGLSIKRKQDKLMRYVKKGFPRSPYKEVVL